MRFLRRALCAAATASAVLGAAALAQPIDHLTIVAPAAPGGGWDQTARALQHVVDARHLSRVAEVQNVPGAAGTIGLSQFIDSQRGRGDALLVTGLVMLGATLWNNSPVSVTQATPIARLTGEYEVIAVPASSPLRDMLALLDEFRRRPSAFAWGGGSAGGTDHILAGLVAEAAGVDPRRVNYVAFSGGGEAVASLLGGHITAGISGYSEFAPHIASGRLRALGLSAGARLPGIDVPTLKETGLDVEMANWRGVLAPAGLAGAGRAKLTALVREAVHTEEWRRILAAREWNDQYLDGDAFAEFLASEQRRYGPIVARLRGPAPSDTTGSATTLVPAIVFGGGAVVLVLFIARRVRERRLPSKEPTTATGHGEVASVCAALLLFLVLLTPAGFVGASTAMFVLIARAFERLSVGAGEHARRRPRVRDWIVAPVFCLLVYLAFTRGLDLPLPEARFWSWMR